MDKRYQVFVSSTFTDLKEERGKVIQTLMELDCIPAGMEVFPAIDDEQFEFIKKVIDDCDYYLLIIGGRYGSLSDDGISYTEKEYDYAVSKGMKVIAFIHEAPEQIPAGKSESSPELREKLEKFKQKVSTGRLCKAWSKAEELSGLVALSLPKTIKTYPAIGWVRSDTTASPELYKELNELRKENEKLRELNADKGSATSFQGELADLDDEVKIVGKFYDSCDFEENGLPWEVFMSWSDIFKLLSTHLLTTLSDDRVKKILGEAIYTDKINTIDKYDETVVIEDQIFQTIKIQFKALGLIELTSPVRQNKPESLLWNLTEKGDLLMMNLLTVKKAVDNTGENND